MQEDVGKEEKYFGMSLFHRQGRLYSLSDRRKRICLWQNSTPRHDMPIGKKHRVPRSAIWIKVYYLRRKATCRLWMYIHSPCITSLMRMSSDFGLFCRRFWSSWFRSLKYTSEQRERMNIRFNERALQENGDLVIKTAGSNICIQ